MITLYVSRKWILHTLGTTWKCVEVYYRRLVNRRIKKYRISIYKRILESINIERIGD